MNTLLTAASVAFTDSKIAPKRSAKRCLFGKSPDNSDNFVKRLMDEIHEEYKAKWDFDFDSDTPLASSSKYIYTKVDPAAIPGFYRLASYVATASPSHEFYSENKDPEEEKAQLDSSMETEDSFLLPTTDESTMSDFFNDSHEKVVLKSAKKLAATPKKRQAKINDFMPTRKHIQRSAPKKTDLMASPSSVRTITSRLRRCSAV